jgi:geranylgeranyl pyrophosphate synthase
MVSMALISANLDRRRDVIEEALEEFVQQRMAGSEATAMKLASDILLAGGKRYRPIIALLAYEAAGGDDTSEVMNLAMAAEIIHTATLVHDDIYDQSKVRRGKPTLHTSSGLPHAIIAGDYLFALGFGLGGRHEDRVVERVAEACGRIATGELQQLEHIGNLATTPEDYYTIVDGKTAFPFASGCWGAAVIAKAPEATVTALELFGMEFGRAFQMVDDLLDLTGEPSMGKPRGADVHDGKMTLPIIHALTMLHGVEREQLADVLQNFSDERWEELIELLDAAESLDYVKQLIENHVERAMEALETLPRTEARDLMFELVKISESRRN